MIKTMDAVFDGTAIFPDEPLSLKPNTRVRITIETVNTEEGEPMSFLDTALSLKLEGPPDWSENIEKYLYEESTR